MADPLMEPLPLRQTGKIQKSLPVVLLGKAYWKSVINWQKLGVYGVINPAEVRPLI
jgi:predicted Rossmann-fold nucleotide-binding protein